MPPYPTRIRGPVAVIGDVHGQTEKFVALLEKLQTLPDYDDRWLVFLGDFVDRGPDPRGTMELLADLRIEHPRTTAVCGNHELAMATAFGWVPSPTFSPAGEHWLDVYDSETTFESYGAEPENLDDLEARMPPLHQELIATLPWVVEHPEYLFVHAGLDSNLPTDMQLRVLRQRDFTLHRPKWLCSQTLAARGAAPADCRQTIVSGHVRVPRVDFGDRRIRVDTTGGADGDLSCVLLPERRVISSGDEPVQTASRGGWKFWSR